MKKAEQSVLQWPKGKLDFSAGTVVMGILNVTPDSFSDGGRYNDMLSAVEHAVEMARAGAAIIDVGPESTRPGAEQVSALEQIHRAVPVIKLLAEKIKVPISIDTYNPAVAAASVQAGASIINDITALDNPEMLKLAADEGLPVILMHMQGGPSTMQKNPRYKDVVSEVLSFLLNRAARAEKAGIPPERIFIDPGIGFGKTIEHNLRLLRNLDKFTETHYRVLIGTSRKRFIGQLTGKEDPPQRLFGTAATVAYCTTKGVSVVRVHDVPEMVDVVKVASAVSERTHT